MSDKKEILNGIDDRELKLFIAKGFDKAYEAQKKYEPAFSDFTDPVRAAMLKKMAERAFNVEVRLFGGYELAERVMAGFFPEYSEGSFPIAPVVISYSEQYAGGLSHRDFLGSVLGLGLERGTIGDIIVKKGSTLIFVKDSVADFIIYNLEKVKHTKVKCSLCEEISEFVNSGDGKELTGIVASSRVDAVISKTFNVSRSAAAEFIKAGRVFINWVPVENVSKHILEGDVITLRGKGRIRLVEFIGNTKKDKLIIKYVRFN